MSIGPIIALLICTGLLLYGIGLLLNLVTKGKYWFFTNPGSRFLYKEEPDLNPYFKELLEAFKNGTASVEIEHYMLDIVFDDGNKRMVIWNVNRWYAWGSKGIIYLKEGEEFKGYEWSDSRPSSKLINKLIPYVEKFKAIEESKLRPIKLFKKEG